MKTAAFVPFWSEGKDSFLSDPPNADISILEDNKLQQVVVVLRDPVLQGDSLSYTVKLLQGDMPVGGADASVFIDIIGMPLTPLSYAGVARRSYRRAWMYRWMHRQEPPACIKPAPASDCTLVARSDETLRLQHPDKECRP